MHWYYLTYRDGYLYDEDNDLAINQRFNSLAEAEDYLVAEDIRANIR
jgi:hypothetical protein